MSEKRLSALTSYQQLPPRLQSMLKLALLHRIPGPKAAALLNLPNPSRTWESGRVQRVLAEYGGAVEPVDYVELLDEIRRPIEPAHYYPPNPKPEKQPETAPPLRQDGPREAAEPPPQSEYLPFRPTTAHRANLVSPSEIVLGGAGSVDPLDLFPNVKAELAKGLTTADIWREQNRTEADERNRLLSELREREERNHWR